MGLLRDEEIAAALGRLPGWQQHRLALGRTYELDDFAAAMRFVRRIADLADACGRLPEILVRGGEVTLTLSGAAAGGMTDADLDLIRRIDAPWTSTKPAGREGRP